MGPFEPSLAEVFVADFVASTLPAGRDDKSVPGVIVLLTVPLGEGFAPELGALALGEPSP